LIPYRPCWQGGTSPHYKAALGWYHFFLGWIQLGLKPPGYVQAQKQALVIRGQLLLLLGKG